MNATHMACLRMLADERLYAWVDASIFGYWLAGVYGEGSYGLN